MAARARRTRELRLKAGGWRSAGPAPGTVGLELFRRKLGAPRDRCSPSDRWAGFHSALTGRARGGRASHLAREVPRPELLPPANSRSTASRRRLGCGSEAPSPGRGEEIMRRVRTVLPVLFQAVNRRGGSWASSIRQAAEKAWVPAFAGMTGKVASSAEGR